ncbi:MAG: glucuronate isomerase [Saprospiraceae bacterium]|nr:glucuronate isomerase [Saprospiraceae bacterium]
MKNHHQTNGKSFIHDDFLLESDFAAQLYHNFAAPLPIIDYHNHLSPADIATNKQFRSLTEVWLSGDHYKWRAMRANGVQEYYITGDASDWEKFEKWAETVPATIRNPLFHWTHLELKRYFQIDELLTKKSARLVFEQANEQLNSPTFSTVGLLQKMQVESLCTTDDPSDKLSSHKLIKENGSAVFPTFRPDQTILIQRDQFPAYIGALSEAADLEIYTFSDLLTALSRRMDYFEAHGCKVSDHGLERMYAAEFTVSEADQIFQKRLTSHAITPEEAELYQSAILFHLGLEYHRRGWIQQFHLGALRNNNSRLYQTLGADAGTDSIGDEKQAYQLSRFLDSLDKEDHLAKTILYNLNPADNEVFASMIGNFNDGSVPGKIQWGSAWWFLDQKDGMEKQLNTLSNLGLLARFVGMLTDSRSFLSFPRHEYFRRILCNLIGRDVTKGELPADLNLLGPFVQDICYFNAKHYFNFQNA